MRISVAGEHLLAAVPAGAARQAGDPMIIASGRVGPHGHGELAWRLRHLRRTILRDASPASSGVEADRQADSFETPGSFLDRALLGSARAAGAFFADTDFTGQLNFLTSSSLAGSGGQAPEGWSPGIALVSVGAPVGMYGDWSVRGAVRAGDLSSWVLLGEYRGRDDMAHEPHFGMSYSVQGDASTGFRRRLTGPDERRVGAVFGYDRWQVTHGVEVEYGLRLDRYDYVLLPDLVSPRLAASIDVLPDTRVTASAARHVVAPGASEFLPPSSSGLWIPPERTFSTLRRGDDFRAERVRHVDVGIERDFVVRDRPATVAVRRFHQAATDQVATLFGASRWRPAGHYRVATAGDVDIRGWSVRVAGELRPYVDVALDYAVGSSEWRRSPGASLLERAAPSAARTGRERFHDMTMRVNADIPESDTRVSFAYRASSMFAREASAGTDPAAGGRFDVEIHQGLPYRPVRGSQLEALLAIRNLFRDARAEGSLYDELLTIAPPLRVMGGVRIRF
jgi:outer membrane receptor protein involved in Fe transport